MSRLAILTSHPIQYYGPLFRELTKRIDIHVFFAHRATSAEQARAGFGIKFDWDVDITSGYSHNFLKNAARRKGTDHFFGCDTPEIGAHLRVGKFDAVLITGWNLKAYFQGVIAAKRLGLPVMVRGDSHLGTPRARLKNIIKSFVYPLSFQLFDAALYVGRRSRTYFEHYGISDEQLFFSPHSVDAAWFADRAMVSRNELRSRLGIAADAKVALFAGKLVSFKRPLDLVAATAALRSREIVVHILVAGSGPLKAELSAAAEAAGVPIHLLGFCNQTEMPKAYAAADVLVLPSSGEETWGLVANEALACGRPIIVSDACGCAPDLAEDGSVGRVFPVGNVAALSHVLEAVLHNPPAPMAIRNKTEKYSLTAAAQGVETAFTFVVKRGIRKEGLPTC